MRKEVKNKFNLFLKPLEYGQSKELLEAATNQNKMISVIIFFKSYFFPLKEPFLVDRAVQALEASEILRFELRNITYQY